MSDGTSNFVAPNQQRYLRACMVCSIVMTYSRFRSEGCPNCPFLNLRANTENIESCTSQVYEGLIAMGNNGASWVAKWQRIDGYVKGMYALKVAGSLPPDVMTALQDEGIEYIPRDGSATEQE